MIEYFRCFDSSRHVQAKALDSLHILLKIMSSFASSDPLFSDTGGGGPSEHLLEELRRLSVSCSSPSCMSTSQETESMESRSTRGSSHDSVSVGDNVEVIAGVVASILQQDVDQDQVWLLLISSILENRIQM